MWTSRQILTVVCVSTLYFATHTAQESHGTIQRNALETSGAVMPGDIVTTTDAAMNVTVKITTNSDGVGSLLFVHIDVHKGA